MEWLLKMGTQHSLLVISRLLMEYWYQVPYTVRPILISIPLHTLITRHVGGSSMAQSSSTCTRPTISTLPSRLACVETPWLKEPTNIRRPINTLAQAQKPPNIQTQAKPCPYPYLCSLSLLQPPLPLHRAHCLGCLGLARNRTPTQFFWV